MYFAGSDHHHQPRSDSDDQHRHREYSTCSQGHTSSLILQTLEGGSICLVCFSNLISNPKSPTVHVSYALSQLTHAISQPPFLHNLLTFHPHFLVSPLVTSLSSFEDEPLAKQTIDLISDLCRSGECPMYGEFVARVSDRLSSGSLAWSRRQVYMLHCLGVLLDYQKKDPCIHIKDKDALVLNLVTGLRLPSEEIQGEILFVLYRIYVLQHAYTNEDGSDILCAYSPKLLHLSLEALLKTQRDDVRLNCVAFLSVLARRGLFENTFANDTSCKDPFEADNFMQTAEDELDGTPLNILFAEAMKAPLLSSDCQVQTATLDLVVLYLSSGGVSEKEVQVLVEENIADYVFEILRLSGCKDPLVNSCLQVLDLLSVAELAFKQRLAIGFTTMVSVIRYVAEVPFHPVQYQSLKLILESVSHCPGIVSSSNIEEISLIVTGMLKKHIDGETGMLPDAFTLVCSVLVALMKTPSSYGTPNFAKSLQDASKHTISTCLSFYGKNSCQILHTLYLLKEAFGYSFQGNPTDTNYIGLRDCILDVCKTKLLPWVSKSIYEIDEDVTLGVLETFHSILLQADFQPKEFAQVLVSSSWFSFSFGCLGLFPTEKMKWRVYFLLSSILDVLLGNEFGQCIRDAALHLPSDPVDLFFLLGQKGSHNQEVFCCQSAVLLILYTSSLYDDRLADDKMILASLEQYILLNSSEILCGVVEPLIMEVLVNSYGLYRGLAKASYQIPYSPEAESTLFHLVAEKECDFLSTRSHFTSLKWLFQQEGLFKSLSDQVLRLCRQMNLCGNQIVACNNTMNLKIRALSELLASGDNYGAKLLVSLLRDLVEEARQEHDIILVLNLIATIITFKPAASVQLCLYGIAIAIQNLYYHSRDSSSEEIFMLTSQLLFTILHSVDSESLSDDEAWVAITRELTDYLISTLAADGWTQEALLVIGILSLILHHSVHQTFVEASKTILLNTSLISIVNNMIHEACSKGPALLDHDETTKTGETLIFVLILNYFCLRSVHVVLPGIVDAQSLLDNGNEKQQLFWISINCPNLCRLLHFGSSPVKLVSSYCLLELFHKITEQKRKEPDKLKHDSYLVRSATSVLGGLIFYNDIRVAMNCALCISMVKGWEKLEVDTQVIGEGSWSRLIVEELVMSLAVPCLASKSIMIHHKPAVHVAVSLLKQQQVPPWMSAVFDDSCINDIIQNLSPGNLTCEMVLLFRELLNSGYLKTEQITGLNQLFQACRKRIYSDDVQNANKEKDTEKMHIFPDNVARVYELLINLISSISSPDGGLLEEIELFCRTLMEADDD